MAAALPAPIGVREGDFLAHYELVAANDDAGRPGYACFGAGAYGVVLACQKRAGAVATERCAVKIVGTDDVSSLEKELRPLLEINAAISKDGDEARQYFVTLLDHFVQPPQAFLVFECPPSSKPFGIPATTGAWPEPRAIFDYITTKGLSSRSDLLAYVLALPDKRLGLEVGRYLARDMLRALDYMHRRLRRVHRDLKPENFLVFGTYQVMTPSGPIVVPRVKIADLGMSKDATCAFTRYKTERSAYAAPEIHRASLDNPTTAVADMFMLGATLFAVITGCSPLHDAEKAFPERFHAYPGPGYPSSIFLDTFFPVGSPQLDFLQILTLKEPARRATAQVALLHPWMP